MSKFKLKYFMWGYQHFFCSSAEGTAEELFGRLHQELDVSLFLVGIKDQEQDDQLYICVEPDHHSVQPEVFTSIEEEIQIAIESDERSQMMYSNPVAGERVEKRFMSESLARAIEKCCEKTPGQESRIFMASDPMNVECFAVSCVLSFDRKTFQALQIFSETRIDRVPVERSLPEAIAREFLACCRDALREENAGENGVVIKASSEELLCRGGQRFLKSLGWRAFGIGSLENAHGLWNFMNAISAMYYEGSTVSGRFILCGRNSAQNKNDIQFTEAVSLRQSRRIRKLLELTRNGYALLVADNGVVGLTDKQEGYRFLIDVPGHRHWRVLVDGDVVCEIKYGIPCLPRPHLENDEFVELCLRVLPDGFNADQLWQIAMECMRQKHGTTLVVSGHCQNESSRLSRQSTLIKPRVLTQDEISAVTSIDGAILVDPLGACHGVGVILDGIATEDGDPARGARYNSAIRYLNSQGGGCLILIVSEDGDVTLLPQLRPRVSRRAVNNAVENLMRIVGVKPLQIRLYADCLKTVDQFRFYLSESQCEKLNVAVDEAESELDQSGRTVKIVRSKFKTAKEMNDSYFLPVE